MQPASTFQLVQRLAAMKREEAPEARAARISREKALAASEFNEAAETHLWACGLAEREAAALLGGLNETWLAYKAVQAFWKDKDAQFLLIAGEPGTGKTLAACSLFLGLWLGVADPDGYERRYWLAEGSYRLAGRLADRPPFDPMTRRETHALCARRLLVLDELGTEGVMTDPWRSCVDELVDTRYRSLGKKTVLLSNVSVGGKSEANQFKERYGARVWRRVREAGRVLSLPCLVCARGLPCAKCKKEGA